MNIHPTDTGAISLAEHSYFFVGSRYVEEEGRTLKQGGMYVEKFVPVEQKQATPVVLFHGGGQSGTNFIATPDGRRGWLHDFLRAGYSVYIVDQPERGRSGHSLKSVQGGQLAVDHVERVENYFTAPAKAGLWPQASRHTQWPGQDQADGSESRAGQKGDLYFDQFFASQVDALADRSVIEQLNQQSGIALLEHIGPAILLTHSQSGPFGWLLADACPQNVKSILALEPNGPPFFDVKFSAGNVDYESRDDKNREHENWYQHNQQSCDRPFGITRIPLTFEPPLMEGEQLQFVPQEASTEHELVSGFLQSEPARQLPNLQGIPILIMVAEASYHACYDHITSAFLRQAGVDHDFVYLHDHGFHGNGHMVMLEKNNHQVADFIIGWLQT